MRYCLLAGLIFCLPQMLGGQIGAEDFLKTAFSDPLVQTQNLEFDFLQQHSLKLPFLQKLDFRTETNDFNLNRQEYLLRFSNNSFGMMRNQSRIYDLMKSAAKTETQVSLQSALELRFSLVHKVRFARSTDALLQKQHAVLVEQKTVLERQWASGLDNTLTDLIKVEDDLLKLESELLENQAQLAEYQNQIRVLCNCQDTLTGVENEWIEVTEMAETAREILKDTSFVAQSLERERQQWQLAWYEEKQRLKSDYKVLDFFQFRYNADPQDVFREKFSVGLAFDIPVPNSSKLRRQELRLETLNRNIDFQTALLKSRRENQQLGSKLENLLLRHADLLAKTKAFLEKFDLRRLQEAGHSDPLTFLKIKEAELIKSLQINKLESEIFETYLQLLDSSGWLGKAPYRDYLRPGSPVFQP